MDKNTGNSQPTAPVAPAWWIAAGFPPADFAGLTRSLNDARHDADRRFRLMG